MAKKDESVGLNLLDDRVAVFVKDADDKTPGGIILPDAAKQKSQEGTVVAVGPGRLLDSGTRVPLPVAVGDTVLFGKYGGVEVEVGGKEYKVLREGEVIATVKK